MPGRKKPLPNTIVGRSFGISGGATPDETGGQTLRTRRVMARRLLGATWLGAQATMEEYCFALYCQQQNIKYIYQAPFAGYRLQIHTDFLILHHAPALCVEIQGDKYHDGAAQVAADRARIVLIMSQGATVIQIWGHSLVGGYPHFPVPTDAQTNRICEAAVNGIELSHEWG